MRILLAEMLRLSFPSPAIMQTAGDNVVLTHVSTGIVLDVLRDGVRRVDRPVRVCR